MQMLHVTDTERGKEKQNQQTVQAHGGSEEGHERMTLDSRRLNNR